MCYINSFARSLGGFDAKDPPCRFPSGTMCETSTPVWLRPRLTKTRPIERESEKVVFSFCPLHNLALWGIEVPQVAPRFGPNQGISWQFFFGFVYVWKALENIFFSFLCVPFCGIWHLMSPFMGYNGNLCAMWAPKFDNSKMQTTKPILVVGFWNFLS